ncbi:MAG: two-component system sensor histidine kinase NtrB [Verrucomicrobiaceae bacterium]|nr:two-component system sensor histidine kinase NtrB [Verrucomicrobiaceae bacterium]
MAPETLHTRILDNLKTAILLVESDLKVGYINSAAEALLEVSGSRMLGEPITSLFIEQGDTEAGLREAVRAGSAYTKRETVLTLISGQQITVDYAVSPVLQDNGRTSLVLEVQPLDRMLRISREEGILSSQQNTRALVRGLAHEIKNPLGGLRGAAQLLARELPDNALKDYTNIIIEEADRLRNLVDQMLGPHKVPDKKPLNLHEAIERVRQLLEAETSGRIRFVRDYDPSIPDLLGDKEQLIQAVLNIVRNAVEAITGMASPPEIPTILLRTRTLRQFTIGTQRHRLVARVDIIDNGPGVPTDIFETIFLPMVSGRPDGTGLGLSISQSIINRHSGLIECHSRPENTTFSLYIPLEHIP